VRAVMSAPPPGGKPTNIRIGFVGYMASAAYVVWWLITNRVIMQALLMM